MQTIHSPSNSGSETVSDDGRTTTITTYDVLETGVSVLFSSNPDKVTADLTEAEIQIIDTFFQSLQWDNDLTTVPYDDPVADLVTFGNLMELVDFDNRWAYKGSGTTPPCTSFVYWNVLSTVYPIKAEHVELFKNQLARGQDGDLKALGNWRETQDIDNHGVIYVSSNGKFSQKITNMFRGASTYLSVGAAALSAVVAATI